MKNVLILLSLLFTHEAMATCATPVTRSQFTNREVLTSTRANLEFNNILTQINELPGDCITDETVTSAKIDDGTIAIADVSQTAINSVITEKFETIFQAHGMVVMDQTDTLPYVIAYGGAGNTGTAALSGAAAISVFYLNSADYPAPSGKTLKLRILSSLHENDTASTESVTVGLYPITRPASSGGNQAVAFSVGTVVSGSTVLFTTPAADSSAASQSTEFTFPTTGYYAIGYAISGGNSTYDANAAAYISARLQVVFVD